MNGAGGCRRRRRVRLERCWGAPWVRIVAARRVGANTSAVFTVPCGEDGPARGWVVQHVARSATSVNGTPFSDDDARRVALGYHEGESNAGVL